MDLITVTRKEGLSFEIGVRGHRVTTDMSKKEGGQDQGFSPVELMAGTLGACVATMAQAYCERHAYEGDVEVSLTLELADSPKRVGAIVVDLELPDSVPDDRMEAIRRVVERCPVHETLRNPLQIDIDFA